MYFSLRLSLCFCSDFDACMRRKYNFFFNWISRPQYGDNTTDTCSGRRTERPDLRRQIHYQMYQRKGTSCQFSPCGLVLVTCHFEKLERLISLLFGCVTAGGDKNKMCVYCVFIPCNNCCSLQFFSDNKTLFWFVQSTVGAGCEAVW